MSALIIGAGPGLGLSLARRIGQDGHRIALISRSPERHASYLADLRGDGIEAGAFVADARDSEAVAAAIDEVRTELGPIDVLYWGPGASDPSAWPVSVTEAGSRELDEAMRSVRPALDAVRLVLPDMLDRRAGTLLFATGLGAVRPLPPLGALALSAAAIRTYALTLNAALAPNDVYAGAIVIGGLIERGDIHQIATAAGHSIPTLDPDVIADTAWTAAKRRDTAEVTFSSLD